ncbi:MAG TPA: hypothetical protein VJQ53_06020, partial [Candidatus Eisenbacteria bacterium]|nr:hypothetical protein [Candidatus Eisenbacteria bacterium]
MKIRFAPPFARRGLSALVGAALILTAPSICMAAPAGAGTASVAAPAKADPPFARIYLAIRGCTSCSHCRTSIRQMVRSNAGG